MPKIIKKFSKIKALSLFPGIMKNANCWWNNSRGVSYVL